MLDADRSDWSNFGANLVFLEQTGLLDRPQKILEIGCGKARLAQRLQEAGHEMFAIDMQPAVLGLCPPEVRVTAAEGSDLPFDDNSFDIVISFDVIEHIPDTVQHLSEVRRVLRPGGHYAFMTPNKWTNIPFEMIRWSSRYGVRRMFDFLKPPEHCALHSYSQLKRRMRSCGFAVEFYDIGVVNDYFTEKVRTYLGRFGVLTLSVLNPDKLPVSMRTNFYVKTRPLG